VLNDAGAGSSSAFGGPCHTPSAERLAAGGLNYNRFHPTAPWSPTRQALLTGRNHHAVGTSGITSGSPGQGRDCNALCRWRKGWPRQGPRQRGDQRGVSQLLHRSVLKQSARAIALIRSERPSPRRPFCCQNKAAKAYDQLASDGQDDRVGGNVAGDDPFGVARPQYSATTARVAMSSTGMTLEPGPRVRVSRYLAGARYAGSAELEAEQSFLAKKKNPTAARKQTGDRGITDV
jgi:hypothetical protein